MSSRKQVAIAILYQFSPPDPTDSSPQANILMQLRDDIPGIVYPGHWGLFGGHLEPRETPIEAMYRELEEEIQYHPTHLDYFGSFVDPEVERHVFKAELEVPMTKLTLREGWDMGLLTASEIQTGACYSAIAKQVRPVGKPHLRILHQFWYPNLNEENLPSLFPPPQEPPP